MMRRLWRWFTEVFLGRSRGWAWHVHHEILVEWTDDIRKRREYVRQWKPGTEQEVRQRLLKMVRHQPQAAGWTPIPEDVQPVHDWLRLHEQECGCPWRGSDIYNGNILAKR